MPGPWASIGLTAWGERFGFGRPTGVELPDEAAGSLPHAEDDMSEAERLAMVRSLAIGQGTLRVNAAANRAVDGRAGQRRPAGSSRALKKWEGDAGERE